MKITDLSGKQPVTETRLFCVRTARGEVREETREINVEHPMEIYVNEALLFRIVCTPEHLAEAALGRLCTEGILRRASDVVSLYLCETGARCRIFLREGLFPPVQGGGQEGQPPGRAAEQAEEDKTGSLTGAGSRLQNPGAPEDGAGKGASKAVESSAGPCEGGQTCPEGEEDCLQNPAAPEDGAGKGVFAAVRRGETKQPRERETIDRLYGWNNSNSAAIPEKGSQGEEISEEKTGAEAAIRESTCCTDNISWLDENTVPMKNIGSDAYRLGREITPTMIFMLAERFHRDSELHRATGGTHSCYLLNADTGVIYASDDIGRHNALDKAVGMALLDEAVPGHCVLFTTGRVPADMARKAIGAGIPVLASKGVPTTEALALAHQYHLTLAVRAWPDSYEIAAGQG